MSGSVKGMDFEYSALRRQKLIRDIGESGYPACFGSRRTRRFESCYPDDPVRNSVVEAHSDEMVVDGSIPSVPTNVAHRV